MLSFIFDALSGLLGWIAGLLPDSPFADIIDGFANEGNALHWLNWFVPVGAMANVFVIYLGALIVWMAVNGLLDGVLGRLKSIVGGSTELMEV